MYAVTSPSDIGSAKLTGVGRLRVDGGVSVRFAVRSGRSALADVRERDGYMVRFPRSTPIPEAILINTGGGLAGGDRVRQAISVDEGAVAAVTTQAAERVYRSIDGLVTHIATDLTAAAGSSLAWLPQPTILFDRSALARTVTAHVAPTATMLIAETVILGRRAMAEQLRQARWRDTWRVRRGDKLIFAENVKMEGDIASDMQQAAVGGGATIIATLLFVTPGAADRLEAVRSALDCEGANLAASSWSDMLVVRGLGSSSEAMQRALARIIEILTGRPVPRAWWT